MNTPSPPRSRFLRVLIIVLIAAGAIALLRFVLPFAIAWHHFSTNPDFHTFAQANPVAQLPATHWPAAHPLTTTGDWSTGPIDPFTLDPDDPDHEQFIITHTVTIKHGQTILLEHTREAAAAIRRADGTQHAFATRIAQSHTHPDFRIHTRTWLSHPDALFNLNQHSPESIRFQTFLLAGSGEPIHEVHQGIMPTPLPAPPPQRNHVLMLLTGLIHPPSPRAANGLFYTVTQDALTGHRFRKPGNLTNSIGHGMPSAAASTLSYSYDIKVNTAEPGGSSRSHHYILYEWNGKVW